MNEAAVVEELELLAAGPELAARLAGVDRAELSDQGLLRVARARHRLVAHLQAQLLADLHELATRPDRSGSAADAEVARREWAEVEVAFALRWTAVTAAAQVELAREVIAKVPAVFVALDRGEVDVPRARVICDAVLGLDQEAARAVVDRVIDDAGQLTTGQLRARLGRLVLAADPQAAARRAVVKVARRRVEARLTEAGVGEVHGWDLPPHRLAAAMERLTAIAVAARAAGDARRLDQLRADAMLDLLVGEGVAAGGPVSVDAFCAAADRDWPDTTPALPDPWLDRPDHPDPAQSVAPRPAQPRPAQPRPAQPRPPRPAAEWPAPPTRPAARAAPTAPAARAALAGREERPDPAQRAAEAPPARRAAPAPVASATPATPAAPVALPGPRRGVIDMTVPLTTLLDLADEPAHLAGMGPVVADIARQTFTAHPDATLRFSITNTLGEVIHHGTTRRRPTATVAAFVRARHRTCIAPGCRRPATGCDLDHTTPWAAGGTSDPDNLAPLCRRHHRFKHTPGTDLTSFAPGTYGWTTPTGMQYITRPEPLTPLHPHPRR